VRIIGANTRFVYHINNKVTNSHQGFTRTGHLLLTSHYMTPDHPHSRHPSAARLRRYLTWCCGGVLLFLAVKMAWQLAGSDGRDDLRIESSAAALPEIEPVMPLEPETSSLAASSTPPPRVAVEPSVLDQLRETLRQGGSIHHLLLLLDAAAMPEALALAVPFGLYEAEGEALTAALMRRWGELDADAAMRHAAKIGGIWGGPAALHALATAPERKAEWMELAGRLSHYYRAAFFEAFWDGLSSDTTPAWRQWLETQPAGEVKEAATSALAWHWGKFAPDEVASWLKQQDPQGSIDRAYARLAEAWSATDPVAAMEWTATLEGNFGQGYAQQAILTAWTKRDVNAAFRYVSALPQTPLANDFRYWFIEAGQTAAPALAAQVNQSITDPELRAVAQELITQGRLPPAP
jgi:hypothetical protein